MGQGDFYQERTPIHISDKQDKLEEVDEVRIETIVPESLLKKTVTAMIKAHPYEEVAYDVYPVENKGEMLGLGRIGTIN